MGNAKKNKIGGAPKSKGRLQAALVAAQAAQAGRARAAVAEAHKVERAKQIKALAGGVKPKKEKPVKGKGKQEELEEEEEVSAPLEAEVTEEPVVKSTVKEGKAKTERVSKRRRGLIPYGAGDRILLVGEGNFSFAHSLIAFDPPQVTASLLLATSFDSLKVASEKYPDLMEHVDAITATGAKVLFGVDATALEKTKEIKDILASGGFDKVGFNFPHVGAGITDQDRNIRANQTLILRFLRSVAPFLRKGPSSAPSQQQQGKKRVAPQMGKRPMLPRKRLRRASLSSDDEADAPIGSDPEEDPEDDSIVYSGSVKPAGTVLLTLRTHAPYSLWSLSSLATRGPLLAPSILPRPLPKDPQPTYVTKRSLEFELNDYEGYEHRRTVGFKEGVSSGRNEDLVLSARERGLKKGGVETAPAPGGGEEDVEARKGKKGAMRTWEFELVIKKDEDDAYD